MELKLKLGLWWWLWIDWEVSSFRMRKLDVRVMKIRIFFRVFFLGGFRVFFVGLWRMISE